MILVAIDTAGPVVGVALWCHGDTRVRVQRVQRGAEGLLVPWARELAADAGIALSALDGVVAAHGPGTFTGVRVGLATAVGLAIGLDRPLWTGSSLLSRARAVGGSERVLAMLDARKGRVYALTTQDGLAIAPAADVAPEVALSWVAPGFVATGEGALVYASQVEAAGGRVYAEAHDPAVAALAELGAERLALGETVDPLGVRPDYVRDADAKRPEEV